MDIIGSISGAISLIAKAKALADRTKNSELKEAIVELEGQLLDLQSQIVELRDANQKLKETAAAKAAAPSEVIIKDGVYFKRDGEGPFCTACYDSKKEFSRLTELGVSHRIMGKWKCPVCRAYLGNQ
jgi:hypothetical protein